jgi:hypothetical protein
MTFSTLFISNLQHKRLTALDQPKWPTYLPSHLCHSLTYSYLPDLTFEIISVERIHLASSGGLLGWTELQHL